MPRGTLGSPAQERLLMSALSLRAEGRPDTAGVKRERAPHRASRYG
ncbi:hypothetical protein SAMN05216551_102415 [Chitinasiproducens palmae]|uniref:Uncharacterized protein n=1 Tax=Chitinasiproducens palmae TaxID=1770053 RepID=A0A1H2PMG4_9BURK|nr:hypothetical protein SAMN05216551_102415 [Chitinasiproducens palmae]